MNPYVSLAKQAVESYIKENIVIIPPKDLPKEVFERKAGVFVTIYKIQNTKYELRGCIGTYSPTRKNIAEETIYNSIAAATEDWRFGPLQPAELDYLSYTVYILGEPEPIKDLKDPPKFSEEEFRRLGLDPKKYGIIVKAISGNKTGLLLPDLEGVDTVEKQISIACQKGGIEPKEKIIIYKFIAEKYK
jgi:AmmeMemoRadiSam system protein A